MSKMGVSKNLKPITEERLGQKLNNSINSRNIKGAIYQDLINLQSPQRVETIEVGIESYKELVEQELIEFIGRIVFSSISKSYKLRLNKNIKGWRFIA